MFDIPCGSNSLYLSAGKIQLTSNLVYRLRDPVPIDLSCLLIFTLSIMEIQLCKVIAYFAPLTYYDLIPITPEYMNMQ